MITELDESFAQGARCGHIDGEGRAGSYVLGEEVDLAHEAFANGWTPDPDTCAPDLKNAWISGYQRGYRLAAEGELLPERYQYPVHRKPSTWA
jgi:hypothetical protein